MRRGANLLEAAGEWSPTRLLLMGSAAEYGVVTPGENPMLETRLLRPVSIYGLTKSFQTHFATYFAHARAADVVVARMFNLIAPGFPSASSSARGNMVERYLEGRSESIEVGSLDNSRDYVTARKPSRQFGHRGARQHRRRVPRGERHGTHDPGDAAHRMLTARACLATPSARSRLPL